MMNKNLLINGEFNVAQRGTSFDATTMPKNDDDTYLLDRWILLSDGNDVADVSQIADSLKGSVYIQKSKVQTANKKVGFLQIIENVDCQQIIGDVASLSFQAKTGQGAIKNLRAAILSWSGAIDSVTSDVLSSWNEEGTNPTLVQDWSYQNTPQNLNLTTNYKKYVIENIPINTDAKNVAVFIWVDDTDAAVNDEFYLGQVQLEKGSVVSEFEHRQLGMELLLSQRYFSQVGGADASASLLAVGHVTNTNAAHFLLRYPVEMRIIPTPSTSAANTFQIHVPNAITPTAVGFDTGGQTNRFAAQLYASSTGMTAGNGGRFAANSSSAYLRFDAEL